MAQMNAIEGANASDGSRPLDFEEIQADVNLHEVLGYRGLEVSKVGEFKCAPSGAKETQQDCRA